MHAISRLYAVLSCLLIMSRQSRQVQHGEPDRQAKAEAGRAKLFAKVKRDFEPWADGISSDMVEKAYCSAHTGSFRFQIVKGEPYIAGEVDGFMEFNRIMKVLLVNVISAHSIPDIDIMMTTEDTCASNPYAMDAAFVAETERCPKQAPYLGFDTRNTSKNQCIAIPDFTFGSGGWPLAHMSDYRTARNLFNLTDSRKFEWKHRNAHLFFTGAPTGRRRELEKDEAFMTDRRIQFELTQWTGLVDKNQHVPISASCRYKYLLSLPGNGFTTRLKYLMMCGSPVIFADSGLEEWWFDLLEEGKNIVRVPWDMGTDSGVGTGIRKALDFLFDHPVQAEQIGQAGKELIFDVLTPEFALEYFAVVLRKYASLQNFEPEIHSQAMPLRISAFGHDAGFKIGERPCLCH